MFVRSPTPAPIEPPIVDASDNKNFDWYYGTHAGGMVLNFGKFQGQKMHETSISYLYWCYRTFKYDHPVLRAFEVYHKGLTKYAEQAYAEFVVPFGWKHKNKKISQCRDKPWMLWTMEQEVLTKKYKIYFVALQHWLDHPRHYEVIRDIGELLDPSDYGIGIDLSEAGGHDDEEPTQSDEDFIDDSLVENGYPDDEDEPTQSDRDFIDDSSIVDGLISEEEEVGAAGPSSYAPSPSYTAKKMRRKVKKTRTKRSTSSKRTFDRDFIIPDDDNDEAHGAEDYVDRDTVPDYETPKRITRSASKKMAEARKQLKAPDSDDDTLFTPNIRSRNPRLVIQSDEESEDEPHGSIPSFNLPKQFEKGKRKVKSKSQGKRDDESDVEIAEDVFCS